MKAILTILFALLLAIPAQAEDNRSPDAFDRVISSGTLRCAWATAEPFIYKDQATNQMTGPSYDLVNELAAAAGLTVNWVEEVGYADFAEGFKTNRYDAFCGIMNIVTKRTRIAAFTSPIFYYPVYAYVRQDDHRFNSLADMDKPEVRVADIDGEVFQYFTRNKLPNATEHSLPNMTPSGQTLPEVAHNKADVVVYPEVYFARFNKANPGVLRRAFEAPIEVWPVGLAVAPHEQALLNMLNTGFIGLQYQGRIDAVLDKYGLDKTQVFRLASPYQTPQ